VATIKISSSPDTSFFRNQTFLSDFGDEYIGYFLGHAYLKRYLKGKLLFLQGDPVTSFYIVRHGWVKLFRNLEDGTEVITALCKEGDLFSKSALIEGTNHQTCAQVAEEAIIYEIPAHILRDYIKKDLKLALSMISYLSNSINLLDRQIEQLSTMNADQRVGCFLLHLCITAKGTTAKVRLPCNKELIANYLGMKPETFSRSLAKLKTIGVHTKSDDVEIADIPSLRKYICTSCTNTSTCNGGQCRAMQLRM
jgi:CRP-like cAMP-binding protein